MIDKRKKYYFIIDTETSENGNVIDFGAVLCDKKGTIYKQMGVLVSDFYLHEKLFYNRESGFFGVQNLKIREEKYYNMVQDGSRIIASVPAVNAWIKKCLELYNPVLTAYNLPFDLAHSEQSGIELSGFDSSFCLWKEAARIFGHKKAYINYAIENKAFTAKMNMKTNAEIMSAFIQDEYVIEPHTALEDILYHELPILVNLMKQKKGIKNMAYSWRDYQLPDLVTAA